MLEAASRAVELAKAGGAGVSPGMSGAEA